MKMRMLCGLATALAFLAGPVQAHDLWLGISHAHGQPEVVALYGHPGHFQAATAARLLSMNARLSDGSTADLSPVTNAGDHVPSLIAPLNVKGGGVLVSASYDNGFWTKLPDGSYRNVGKPMVSDGTDSSWSLKYAKTLAGSGAPWGHVVGHPLELVVMTEPSADAKELRIKALFKGQPLAGVEIKRATDLNTADKAASAGRTDASGMLVVKHDARGDFLSASHKMPSSQPAMADSDTYSATLAIVSEQALTQ